MPKNQLIEQLELAREQGRSVIVKNLADNIHEKMLEETFKVL
jgi:hypothetical protein